jgi:glyoxylase-like metal-dependent hydrolase (beta-lactamase superfamily II)
MKKEYFERINIFKHRVVVNRFFVGQRLLVFDTYARQTIQSNGFVNAIQKAYSHRTYGKGLMCIMAHHSQEQASQPEAEQPVAREVASDIWKVTIPIPFPLRTVNMYILRGKEGWALIDTGMGTPDARAAFEEGMRIAGVSLEGLRAIVLTHHHPDHIGLSGELHEKSGAPVYIHPIDRESLRVMYSGTMPERFGKVSDYFAQHGLPRTHLWLTQMGRQAMRKIISVPPDEAFRMVEDGQKLELLDEVYEIIWTPGHADGQICLYRERDGVFFSADHVLPRITPNIGLYSEIDRPNPLEDYLDSLRKVSKVPAQIVLPGHREPFSDLLERTTEIIEHHQQRLAQILGLLEERAQNAAQIVEQLFMNRLKNDESRRMAVAEILSHLEYLRYEGQVKQETTKDGLILYEVV